jgi:hypothetical protein
MHEWWGHALPPGPCPAAGRVQRRHPRLGQAQRAPIVIAVGDVELRVRRQRALDAVLRRQRHHRQDGRGRLLLFRGLLSKYGCLRSRAVARARSAGAASTGSPRLPRLNQRPPASASGRTTKDEGRKTTVSRDPCGRDNSRDEPCQASALARFIGRGYVARGARPRCWEAAFYAAKPRAAAGLHAPRPIRPPTPCRIGSMRDAAAKPQAAVCLTPLGSCSGVPLPALAMEWRRVAWAP